MKKRHAHKKNILLVNITRLGDMLQATPTIAGMKAENPGCKVTVLVEKQFADVCHCIPNIDEVMSIDLGFTSRSIAREQDGLIDAFDYVSEIVDDLRSRNFDYCLNMSSSAYTALLLNLVGIDRSGGWTSDDEGYRIIASEWAQLFATSVFHQNRQFNSLNLVDVFRCSADIEQHPNKLLINVDPASREKADSMLKAAGFTNTGPLIALQAGASQGKRQWDPSHFIELCGLLEKELGARVVLTGSTKERSIIDPIIAGTNSKNVVSFAGQTSIPELAAVLDRADILVTGDTGPMHMSVAVGTPVIAMFLASAFGFETGPYSEGNLVLQPVIGCGPCNPNKPCARPDCHDTISPKLMAELVKLRLGSDIRTLPEGLVDPRQVIVYRSCFDRFGFCDLEPISDDSVDAMRPFREAYRRVWLDDLGGYDMPELKVPKKTALSIVPPEIQAISQVAECAQMGTHLIEELISLVRNTKAPASELARVSGALAELDRQIEQIGFHVNPLGPLTRMFVFAKENIQGTDAIDLASQMRRIYQDLDRRGQKLGSYYAALNG